MATENGSNNVGNESICEIDDTDKRKLELALEELKDYEQFACSNPKSWGVEFLLFWTDCNKSINVRAVCLVKFLWNLLNDGNAICRLAALGKNNNPEEMIKSNYGIKHHLAKESGYWEAIGIPQDEARKFIKENGSLLGEIFLSLNMGRMVGAMKNFLEIPCSDKIKMGFFHAMLRELIKEYLCPDIMQVAT